MSIPTSVQTEFDEMAALMDRIRRATDSLQQHLNENHFSERVGLALSRRSDPPDPGTDKPK